MINIIPIDFAVLIPLALLILGFVWGLWLIFRKGDMVSQPMKILGYFTGALLALIIAVLVTVLFFPYWADQMLGVATESNSVKSLQDKTQQIIDDSLIKPTARPPTTSPTSPLGTPSGTGVGAQGASGKTHVVKAGENLYRIAQQYGVTVAELQKANNLSDPNNIKAGQKLIIP